MGEPKACTNVGYGYLTGQGSSGERHKGPVMFKKACDLGDPMGCRDLAILYRKGIKVMADLKKAQQLYRRACILGSKKSCNIYLAPTITIDGPGVIFESSPIIEVQ